MKKIFLLIVGIIASVGMSAQIVKVYENGSLSATYTNSANDTYKIVCEEFTDPNLLRGKFSVSATKKVQFTKSNLYWDGNAFHLETNQTDCCIYWDTSHIGHFYWTNFTDYQSGTASYRPYAMGYNCSEKSTQDEFWCGENHPLTVDGTEGLYTLTNEEWDYLINGRTNAGNLCKYGVTVTNGDASYSGCLIIAPDGYDFSTNPLQSSYTLDQVNTAGLVCLPRTQYRTAVSFYNDSKFGIYWSATPCEDNSEYTYDLIIYDNKNYSKTKDKSPRNFGCCIRLVK